MKSLPRPALRGAARFTSAALLVGGCTATAGPAVQPVPTPIPAAIGAATTSVATTAKDVSPTIGLTPNRVTALFDGAPLTLDRCKTKVTTKDLDHAWQAFFGIQERSDLSIDELASRVAQTVDALAGHRQTNGFIPLDWSTYGPLERDALGDRKIPLRTYQGYAARYLTRLGANAVFSVARPNATSPLWQDILWNETTPVTERRTGANRIIRATMLSSLQQFAILPPEDLNGITIAFVHIHADDQGGQAVAHENLVMVDVGKNASTVDAAASYRYLGPEAQVAAHEVAHLTSWRVCGPMFDTHGEFDDPVFTSFVPGFAFGPKIVETMTEPGIYKGYIGFERYTGEPVAVARAYGAKSPEEAQAVLLGELANNSRFLGRLYGPTESDPTPIKAQVALWMARLHKSRPASYEYYRLMADVARIRAGIRARLEPLEVMAMRITENSEMIYSSTDPRLEPLKQQGMSRLKDLEDRATTALTGLPPFPTSALNELR